jgi:hypothetical protein
MLNLTFAVGHVPSLRAQWNALRTQGYSVINVRGALLAANSLGRAKRLCRK